MFCKRCHSKLEGRVKHTGGKPFFDVVRPAGLRVALNILSTRRRGGLSIFAHPEPSDPLATAISAVTEALVCSGGSPTMD